jgi:HEAT repeat protein
MGTRAIARLASLLRDERPEVRHAAINALAGFDRPDSRDALKSVMDRGDAGDRAALLKALSARRTPWAVELYEMALNGKDPVLWYLALEGLAAFPRADTQAAETVNRFIDEHGLDTEAGLQGLDALKNMGGGAARQTLLDLLDKAEDKNVERAIIFGLAILGETRIFPRLQECMLDQEYREHAVTCMAFLLVSDFGGETWRYRNYWQKNEGKSQAFFLKVALGLGDPPLGAGESYQGIAKEELVRALRHESWPVRTAALRILEEGAEQSFGELTRYSTDEEVDTVASAWEIWLKSA